MKISSISSFERARIAGKKKVNALKMDLLYFLFDKNFF